MRMMSACKTAKKVITAFFISFVLCTAKKRVAFSIFAIAEIHLTIQRTANCLDEDPSNPGLHNEANSIKKHLHYVSKT